MILPPWLWRLVHSRKFWILLISLPIAGLVLFYTISNRWGARKLDQARTELSAKGYALTWAEVIQAGVAPEEDLLRHAVMLRKPHDIESELVAKGYDPSRLDDWTPDLSECKRFSAAEVCGKPAGEETAAINQLLADLTFATEGNANEIKEAVRTSKGIGWRVAGSVPVPEDPSISTIGWMSNWILRRAVLRAAAGDDVGAMDDLEVAHEYLTLLHKEPRTLLSTVIGMGISATFTNSAWQIARMPSTSREQLQEINQWLDSLDTARTTVDCYQRELVFMNELIGSLFGNITALPPDQMNLNFSWMDAREWWKEGKNCWWQVRPVGLFKAELAEALMRINHEILHLPDGNKRQAWTMRDADRIEAYASSLPSGGTHPLGFDHRFFDDFLKVIPPAIRKDHKVRTALRLCRAGIAAELYRRDHGRLPSAMSDLVPAYLAEVPVDALSETPIRMDTVFDEKITFIANDEVLWIVIPAE
jgi:hypothetical protein